MPDPGEVDEVFEVPLSFLLDPANRERKSAEWQGQRREFYAYTYDGHYIWGATAAILVNFMERLGRHDPHRARTDGPVRAALRAVRVLCLDFPSPPAMAAA